MTTKTTEIVFQAIVHGTDGDELWEVDRTAPHPTRKQARDEAERLLDSHRDGADDGTVIAFLYQGYMADAGDDPDVVFVRNDEVTAEIVGEVIQ